MTPPPETATAAPATHSARSVLGAHASRVVREGGTLPFDDPRHLQAYQWLVDEAWLLDAQAYEEWLAVLRSTHSLTSLQRNGPQVPPVAAPVPPEELCCLPWSTSLPHVPRPSAWSAGCRAAA